MNAAAHGLTFAEMILRVAEDSGIALEAIEAGDVTELPSDAAELEKVKRSINDAIMSLARKLPKARCLQRSVTITALSSGEGAQHVEADPGRVLLPTHWELLPQGRWVFRSTGLSRGSTPLTITTMHEVEALQETNDQTGVPALVALGPIDEDGEVRSTLQRYEMRLWPKPSMDVVVHGMARVRVTKLVNPDDRSPFGPEHDLTIVHMAKFEMKRNDPDLQTRAWYKSEANEAVAESMRLDDELALPSIGSFEDGAITDNDGAPSVGERVYFNGSQL